MGSKSCWRLRFFSGLSLQLLKLLHKYKGCFDFYSPNCTLANGAPVAHQKFSFSYCTWLWKWCIARNHFRCFFHHVWVVSFSEWQHIEGQIHVDHQGGPLIAFLSPLMSKHVPTECYIQSPLDLLNHSATLFIDEWNQRKPTVPQAESIGKDQWCKYEPTVSWYKLQGHICTRRKCCQENTVFY